MEKGETSGNTQALLSLRVDCDKDTLLAIVDQKGVGCHTGAFSCFNGAEKIVFGSDEASQDGEISTSEDVILRLESIIESRKVNPKEGSYTNYLFDKGLDKMLKKVGEEASEVIIAAKNNDREEVTYEVSDLMYHLLVTLNNQNVKWSDVRNALTERFPKE